MTSGVWRAQVVWHHDAAEYMPYQPRPADMWERWAFSAQPPADLARRGAPLGGPFLCMRASHP